MLKKVILASSGYSLITFVHGFTWHLVFFKQVYETFGVYNRANPIIPIGFASMVIQGVVLAVLYHRQVKEISSMPRHRRSRSASSVRWLTQQ